jgi:hypothetical protein
MRFSPRPLLHLLNRRSSQPARTAQISSRDRERVHHCSDQKGISIVIHGREAPVVNFVVGYSEAFIRRVGVRIGTVVTIHPYPWLTSRLSDSQSTILDEWMNGWIRATTKTLLSLSLSLSLSPLRGCRDCAWCVARRIGQKKEDPSLPLGFRKSATQQW